VLIVEAATEYFYAVDPDLHAGQCPIDLSRWRGAKPLHYLREGSNYFFESSASSPELEGVEMHL
jgi:hypothetical protein